MSLMDIFRARNKKTPASIAKERLQIIVSHERSHRNGPDFLPELQKELVAVISKYVSINEDMVRVALEQNDEQSILELNITIPETTVSA